MALPPQLAEQLHAVHARHLDVEHGKINRLRAHAFESLGPVAVRAHRKTFRFERHRYGGQDVSVIVDKSNRIRHLDTPGSCRETGSAALLKVLSLLNMASGSQTETLGPILSISALLP